MAKHKIGFLQDAQVELLDTPESPIQVGEISVDLSARSKTLWVERLKIWKQAMGIPLRDSLEVLMGKGTGLHFEGMYEAIGLVTLIIVTVLWKYGASVFPALGTGALWVVGLICGTAALVLFLRAIAAIVLLPGSIIKAVIQAQAELSKKHFNA